MAKFRVFGNLDLIRGENPRGDVQQTSNGTWVNGTGADGDDYTFGALADGPRWNKTGPRATLRDNHIARPIDRGKR